MFFADLYGDAVKCFVALALLVLTGDALAQVDPARLAETRYCGTPVRNADGSIKRSTAVVNAFKRAHPCPSTGLATGACPGWSANHTIPLACGGCDAVSNMDWMPAQIKSCSQPWCRDRWERNVYDSGITGTDACTNKVLTWPAPAASAP